MVTGHVHVELADGTVEGDISVFFVHVVDSGSGLVSEHNTKCFHMVGSLLVDLINGQDLTLSCFGLKLASQMIPELRFGHNLIISKEPQSIYFRTWVLLSRDFPSHHQVLINLCLSLGGTFIWKEESEGCWAPRLAILTIQSIYYNFAIYIYYLSTLPQIL